MASVRMELKWAVILTFLGWIWIYLEKLIGLHDEHIAEHSTYTNFFVLIVAGVYLLALLDKRNNFYGGTINWKQAFTSGMILTLLLTALVPVSQYVSTRLISPEFFENAIAYAVANDIYTRAEAEAYFNLKNYILQSLLGTLVLGTLLSALIGLVVKRK